MKLKASEVKFRKDLYPRFEPNQGRIQAYADTIEELPPIIINQNNILIDGFHRWKAHQLLEREDIEVTVQQTESEKELRKLAYKYNAHHGLQLTQEEKKNYAQEMIGEQMTVDELSHLLSVSKRTINRWTQTQKEALTKRRNDAILDLYLKCWTHEEIAEEIGVPQQTVSRILTHLGQMSQMGKEFKPLLYNIWNSPKGDTDNNHFGAFPLVFMQNLLFYHTKKWDIVYDPFAGGGTTIKACKLMLRRYYCSDRKVKPGLESEIKQWDVAQGLPDDLPKPNLVFLDPPYWKQAEGKYSNDRSDLGNISLEEFYSTMNNLLYALTERAVERIAIVISPTEYPNDLVFEDHIIEFIKMLDDTYKVEKRRMLPYSTEQYNGTQVMRAKERNIDLNILRDLVVFRRR